MTVFRRLAVCSVVIGIIGAIYVVYIIGIDSTTVISEAQNVLSLNKNTFYPFFSRFKTVFEIFICGFFAFGWLAVLPVLFYRTFSLSIGLFSVFLLNGKEAAVYLPLLVPFIIELFSIVLFIPSATKFSLSLCERSNIRFSARFLQYLLSFLLIGITVSLSAFCDILISKYY